MIDLDALLEQHDGLLLARELRALKSSLSRWCRAGRLARILPGVYVHPGAATELDTRLRAVVARIPDAVIAGAAAARLGHWGAEQVEQVEVLVPGRRVPKPGFRFVRRRVPPELIVRQGRLSRAAAVLIAVDSAATDNGSRIDDLLRARFSLEAIEAALIPGRAGNQVRRRVLQRSRTNPWSQAERRLHDLLDRHRVTGWRSNVPTRGNGCDYWLDAAFEVDQVALEVDGWEFHRTRQAFENDRVRANNLVHDGWTILRFTWAMLSDEERLIDWIEAARAAARRRSRARPRGSP